MHPRVVWYTGVPLVALASGLVLGRWSLGETAPPAQEALEPITKWARPPGEKEADQLFGIRILRNVNPHLVLAYSAKKTESGVGLATQELTMTLLDKLSNQEIHMVGNGIRMRAIPIPGKWSQVKSADEIAIFYDQPDPPPPQSK